MNNILDRLPDGRLKFKGDDWGFGGNAGVLLEPSARTRFGLTYRSPVDFAYADRIKFTNLGPGLRRVLDRVGLLGGKTKLGQTAPQTVMASGYHALTDQLAIMGNVGWQNWEQFGNVDVTISSDTTKSFTTDAHFHNTWQGAMGAQYRLAPPWLLWTGFAYDSAPVSKFYRTPSMPFDRNLRFGAGLQYDWSENMTVGAAHEFLDAGDAEIAHLNRGPLAGTLQGDYSSNYVHFITLNVIWRF